MKDTWWERKAAEIQSYADSNNAKLFYSNLKEVFGPPQRRNPQGELMRQLIRDGQNTLSSSSTSPQQLTPQPLTKYQHDQCKKNLMPHLQRMR